MKHTGRFFLFDFFLIIMLLTILFSCSKKTAKPAADIEAAAGFKMVSDIQTTAGKKTETVRENFIDDYWSPTIEMAGLPDSLRDKILAYLVQGPDFAMELVTLLDLDPGLTLLVDKQHSLERDYVPADLVELKAGQYRVSRAGLMLRQPAAESLAAMAAAARLDGVVLEAASTYRSYDYQEEVYNRNIRELGQQQADRESAKPGKSQHQLGLAVDFYPIDDAFAQTPASAWLQKNAAQFGWSLSFPQNLEEVTGYRWESWHYRYLGPELADFVNKYFDGIQQYAMQFINAWKLQSGGTVNQAALNIRQP
ncbi:MAG: M15 family metallopeptidase [Treponema sp.]|nr:M15 family metallopeptidase [Treponema sp.]